MFPLEQFQLEHGQTMFSEQIAPLVRLRNEVWTMWNREHVLTGQGLARRRLSAQRAHVKNYLISLVLFFYTLRSICTISHTAQTEMCADLKSEWRGTENISQCSQSERLCMRTNFENIFLGTCTENISEQAHLVNDLNFVVQLFIEYRPMSVYQKVTQNDEAPGITMIGADNFIIFTLNISPQGARFCSLTMI